MVLLGEGGEEARDDGVDGLDEPGWLIMSGVRGEMCGGMDSFVGST